MISFFGNSVGLNAGAAKGPRAGGRPWFFDARAPACGDVWGAERAICPHLAPRTAVLFCAPRKFRFTGGHSPLETHFDVSRGSVYSVRRSDAAPVEHGERPAREPSWTYSQFAVGFLRSCRLSRQRRPGKAVLRCVAPVCSRRTGFPARLFVRSLRAVERVAFRNPTVNCEMDHIRKR